MSLELITTEELMEEVFSRFDVACFAGAMVMEEVEMEHGGLCSLNMPISFKGDGTGLLEDLAQELVDTIYSQGGE